MVGLLAVVAAVAAAIARPTDGALLAAAFVAGTLLVALAAVLLYRYPWLVPWYALVIFSTSAELRLRLTPTLGVIKDLFVLLVSAVIVLFVVRHASVLLRLRPFAGPVIALGIVVFLYLLNSAGSDGSGWIFGTRLLVEVLALLIIGLLWPQPRRTAEHLVRAMTVVLPAEAAFAWVQHWAGADALVYGWGYEYGAQIRLTSTGGLRTSGSFVDPFQLAALAVLGLALALFVASRTQTVVLLISAVAALGATSVRTAFVQAGLLLLIYAVRRGWARQAAVLGGVAAIAGLFFLATTTSAVRPGAPQEALLFTLNGRSTAWAQTVQGWDSLVIGNGVGVVGSGSTRTDTLISAPPAYDPRSAPLAQFAGSSAFLDSAYAQIQSDVGIVGSVGFIAGMFGLAVVLVRRCRLQPKSGAAWAAFAVLAVSAIDWVGRASLASYTTGFLTMYMLGVLAAATRASPEAK